MTQDRTKTILTLAATAVLVFSSVAPSVAASELGGATPEEVFERMRAAATDKNYQEMASCLSPKGRAEMNGLMIAMAGMVAAFSGMSSEMAGEMAEATDQAAPTPARDLTADLNAMLARHGLDESSLGPPGAAKGKLPKELESPDLFADVMTFMDELPNDTEGGSGPGPSKGFSVPEGGLKDLEITGDQATAQVGDEPTKFVRVDGRWYIDPDLDLGSSPGNSES